MKRYFLHDRVELFQFNTLGSILLVFGGNVPAGAVEAAGFVLCAFQDHLNAVAFFSHGIRKFLVGK